MLRAKREALRGFMERNNLKVEPWCNKAGISEGTLRAYVVEERTRSMKQSSLEALATAANTTVEKMFSSAEAAISESSGRNQLDNAIALWFKDDNRQNESSISTLAAAAYRSLHKTDPSINDPSEKIIVLSLIALQSTGTILNEVEARFLLWISAHYPKLFSEALRVYFAKFIPADDLTKIGQLSKSQFFKQTGGDINIEN